MSDHTYPPHFEDELDRIAGRFRILGEPVRLRLLFQLRNGEVSVTELSHRLATTQPNVSKHLKVLALAGVVQRRQYKNSAYYSVCDLSVFAICDVVKQAWVTGC
jgi:DNA-binding transcriptional ArsR family regulator